MLLVNLIRRAKVRKYWGHVWFGGCVLDGTVLWVPHHDQAESLARLYGPALRKALPALTMRVGKPTNPAKSEPPRYLNAAGRKAWKGERATEPTQPKLGETE